MQTATEPSLRKAVPSPTGAWWFVTRPRQHSEPPDIVFKVETWRDLAYQFAGGLDPDDILRTFDNEHQAVSYANLLLARAK